jgi:hypothetical protein
LQEPLLFLPGLVLRVQVMVPLDLEAMVLRLPTSIEAA